MHIIDTYRSVAVGSVYNVEPTIHFVGGGGQILTLKNDPTCSMAPRVIIKYKRPWYGVGSNFNVEK